MSARKTRTLTAFIWILISSILLSSCSPFKAKDSSANPELRPINTVYSIEEDHVVLEEDRIGGYVDNIIVVFLKEGVEEKDVLSWFPGENPTIAGRFPRLGQVQIRIKARTKDELDKLAKKLMEKQQVLYAHIELAASRHQQHKNTFQHPQEDFPQEDSLAPAQSKPSNEWWYSVIGLQEAQKHLPKKEFIKVGVVDDGFDLSHPDLKLKFPSKEQEKQNFPEEHGTHVAGIIQQILPESTITLTDSYPRMNENPWAHLSTLSQTMKYLVDMVEADVKVLNYSMGADITDDKNMPWNQEISSVFSVYLWKLKQIGHDFIVVQSAGNAGIDASRNGFFSSINTDNCLGSKEARLSLGVDKNLKEEQSRVLESIVIVAAIEKKDPSGVYKLLSDSNYGNTVTIAAPGIDINSTVPGGYAFQGGTSQAAPMVSGSLGFLWALNPSLSSGELKELLVQSATEFAVDPAKVNGDTRRELYPILNLNEAIKRSMNNSR